MQVHLYSHFFSLNTYDSATQSDVEFADAEPHVWRVDWKVAREFSTALRVGTANHRVVQGSPVLVYCLFPHFQPQKISFGEQHQTLHTCLIKVYWVPKALSLYRFLFNQGCGKGEVAGVASGWELQTGRLVRL